MEERLKKIFQLIRYKNWGIIAQADGDRYYLQVIFLATSLQKGRKWFLSPFMTDSEIVSTAFKAILTAEEHEVREHFKYRGQSIFGPHFNFDRLADLCAEPDALDVRTNPDLFPVDT